MIYTLTFNPSLDYVMHSDGVEWGKTNRSTAEQLRYGGKGINVSVVLGRLGTDNCALGFIAGFTGDALEAAIRDEGVKTDFIRLPRGMTRINVKLKGNGETEINAKGPVIDGESAERLFHKLETISADDILVLAGSVPDGIGTDIYGEIARRLSEQGARLVVDAAGELLISTLKYAPFLIKPNIDELCGICGRKLCGEAEIAEAARELKFMGAANVLVSLGGDGAVLMDANGEYHKICAHKGKVLDTVGAGDSMVAGFLSAVVNGKSYAEALRLGNAAGAATAFSERLAERETIEKLMR